MNQTQRPTPDPMHTARLMEAIDTLSKEAKRLHPEDRQRVTLLLCRIRGLLDLT